ncbi:hypothetical protein lerEdw1_011537 [Lerista edwardsae]|nr:hypothetical protein lerEdw1_011537 [Lerista edwardsae]
MGRWERGVQDIIALDILVVSKRRSPAPDTLTMTMDSAQSISSRESLYSVESTASEEEEEERATDFDVFLLDSGSDTEKEPGLLRHPRDASPEGRGFLFPRESGRTHPGLRCWERRRRARKPLGLLASSRLQHCSPRCVSPVGLEETYCARLVEPDRSLPRKAARGRKRLSTSMGGGQTPAYAPTPALRGLKRQRNKEAEAGGGLASPWTEKDQLFAQKCWELQGFIRPLNELLNRLKMGRFDRGLSSFQQSVAMDRIQRIIGVLQKPEIGERYLGTLLQVERMLKVWFPGVTLKNSYAGCGTAEEKMCKAEKPLSTEKSAGRTEPPGRDCAHSPPTEALHQTHLADTALSGGETGCPWEEPPRALPRWPAMNLTWVHTSPISNPPLGHVDLSRVNLAFGQALLGQEASAYGVVLFLHQNPAGPSPPSRPTSVTPVTPSPPCCPPNHSLPGSAELPRCQSLPGGATLHHDLLRGSLDCHSRSLPHLPTSSLAGSGTGAERGSTGPAHRPDDS